MFTSQDKPVLDKYVKLKKETFGIQEIPTNLAHQTKSIVTNLPGQRSIV